MANLGMDNKGAIAWTARLGDSPGVLAIVFRGPVASAGERVLIRATSDTEFRAVDSDSGKLLWRIDWPAAEFATPSIYQPGGWGFVVIASVGGEPGRKSGSAYRCYALPIKPRANEAPSMKP